MNHITFDNLKDSVRNPYTFPGCYPTCYILKDGAVLCPECARSEYNLIARATKHHDDDMWEVVGQEIVWENDGSFYCDHCNKIIESSYGGE